MKASWRVVHSLGSPAGSLALALTVVFCLSTAAAAQQPPAYAGAVVTPVTQTHSVAQPLGGTTWGGSVTAGAWVSPRLALESEASFSGAYSWEYSYHPGPSWTAHVVASRRDMYFAFQARTRAGALEPVIGAAYALGRIGRHATTGNTTYFNDGRWNHGVAAVGGFDVALKVARHFSIVPTLRVLLSARPGTEGSFDPLGEQTRTGALAFRYGVGSRISF